MTSILISYWIKLQMSNSSYPYGLKRIEVIVIFSISVLSILSAFFTMKEAYVFVVTVNSYLHVFFTISLLFCCCCVKD